MRVAILLLFMPCFTALSNAQVAHISFEAEGFNLGIDKNDVSASLRKLFALQGNVLFELDQGKSNTTAQGEEHLTYNQYINGYKVEAMQVKLHYRKGELYYINGEYVRDTIQPTAVTLQQTNVLGIATNALHAQKYIWEDQTTADLLQDTTLTKLPEPELVYIMVNEAPRFAYRIDVFSVAPLSRKAVYIDPVTGEVIKKAELTCSATGTAETRYSGTRSIENEMSGSNYILKATNLSRGITIRAVNSSSGGLDFTDADNNWTAAEHNSSSDDAALDAYWGMEKVYDYFKNVFNRNSYNGTGGALTSQVHNGLASGATWLGGGAFAFSDGSGGIDILTCLDVMGHEMGHAINEAEASLEREGETGAVNEGLNDIWGACVEHYTVTGKQTWQIAEDADFRAGENGLRSLSNPNSTGQPDTYLGTNWFSLGGCSPDPDNNDNCGVHTNCGVMGYWFYLLSEGGSGTNDNSHAFSVNGIGIEDAADIVYKAVTDYMTSSTLYANMRTYTIKAAQDIFGYCSPEVISVINAWHAVGVGSSYATISTVPITAPIPASTTQDFYSPGTITASNIIDGNSTNIRYRASEAVILEPGFEAKEGTNFVAEIIPCEDLSAAKRELSDNLYHQAEPDETIKIPTAAIKVFPNPMDDYIQIFFEIENPAIGNFVITDASGRKITEGGLTGRFTQVSTQKLSPGPYTISVDINKSVVSYRLIKR